MLAYAISSCGAIALRRTLPGWCGAVAWSAPRTAPTDQQNEALAKPLTGSRSHLSGSSHAKTRFSKRDTTIYRFWPRLSVDWLSASDLRPLPQCPNALVGSGGRREELPHRSDSRAGRSRPRSIDAFLRAGGMRCPTSAGLPSKRRGCPEDPRL